MQDKPQPRRVQVQVAVATDEMKPADAIHEPAKPAARGNDDIRKNVPLSSIKDKPA
jgi:hypothetical protein